MVIVIVVIRTPPEYARSPLSTPDYLGVRDAMESALVAWRENHPPGVVTSGLIAHATQTGDLVDASFETSGPEPLVYMSLGTLHSATVAFYRECLEAFADMRVRFVLSTGNQVDIRALGAVPSTAVVRASVPQLAVLQHAYVAAGSHATAPLG